MKRVLSLSVLCICIAILTLGSINPTSETPLSKAASAQTKALPAASLLNPGGTFNPQVVANGYANLAGMRASNVPQRRLLHSPDFSNAITGSALNYGLNGPVYAIDVSGSDVYVGGYFTQICGNLDCTSGNVTVNHIAKWNGSAWSALGNGLNCTVESVRIRGNDVYVGGSLTEICGNAACDTGNTNIYNLAHWNGSTWSALGYGVNNDVIAIAVSGSDVYVGGHFTQVCGNSTCLKFDTTMNHIARWNGSAWNILGNGVNGGVAALAANGSDVYAGGWFTQVCGDNPCSTGNTTVNHLARWNGSTWSAIGNGVNDRVLAFTFSGSDVYLGGFFTQICGNDACNSFNATANYIAKWNGSSWLALGNGVNNEVFSLASSGSNVYLGGVFTNTCGNSTCNSGNITVNSIAQWSSGTSAWSALGNGVDSNVFAVSVSGSDVVVGGGFTHACGNAACNSGNIRVNYIAMFDTSHYIFLPLIDR